MRLTEGAGVAHVDRVSTSYGHQLSEDGVSLSVNDPGDPVIDTT